MFNSCYDYSVGKKSDLEIYLDCGSFGHVSKCISTLERLDLWLYKQFHPQDDLQKAKTVQFGS